MEELLHYTWKYKLYPPYGLFTEKGQKLEIIDPGLHNFDAGPDFFNAKIKMDGVLWVGNVEIHNSSSDWYRHNHHKEKAYNSVILHVVNRIDDKTITCDGREVPQLQLNCPQAVVENFHELINSSRYPACYKIIPSLDKMMVHSWLNSLYVERLNQKSVALFQRVISKENNWEEALFVTIARNFGFGLNGDVFELWANRIPLKIIQKQNDSLLQIESLFFGQAGLLEDEDGEKYYMDLKREYLFLKAKYSLTPIDISYWKFLRLRPNNFPHIRLSQLAMLYHNVHSMLSSVVEADDKKKINTIFSCATSEYWNNHYSFGKESTSYPKSISKSSIELIIINSIVPILYSYGKHRGDEALCERAIGLLESTKAEYNYITRIWNECGIKVDNAADSQAIIQLKKEYCDRKRCLYCRIGYFYLKSNQQSNL